MITGEHSARRNSSFLQKKNRRIFATRVYRASKNRPVPESTVRVHYNDGVFAHPSLRGDCFLFRCFLLNTSRCSPDCAVGSPLYIHVPLSHSHSFTHTHTPCIRRVRSSAVRIISARLYTYIRVGSRYLSTRGRRSFCFSSVTSD